MTRSVIDELDSSVILRNIDFAEGIDGSSYADRGREEDPNSRRISRAHQTTIDQTGGEVAKEGPQEN